MISEEKRQYNLAYYKANRERLCANSRAWGNTNRTRLSARMKVYYKANREKILEKKRVYTANTRVAKAAYNKKYRADNLEALAAKQAAYKSKSSPYYAQIRARNKAYYKANKEKFYPGARLWQSKNRDKVRGYEQAWAKKNPHKRHAKSARRRARIAGAYQDGTADAFYKFVRSKKSIPCYYCGSGVAGKDAHIDHVIAVSKQGNHSSENLCASCPTCNLRKNNKAPSEIHFLPQPLLNL